MNEAFNKWWNVDLLTEDNPFVDGTPAYWAWEGWCAALTQPEQTEDLYDLAIKADNGGQP